jgi:hypothetical protein
MTYHLYWFVIVFLYENIVSKSNAYSLRCIARLEKHVKVLLYNRLCFNLNFFFLYLNLLFNSVSQNRLLNIPEINLIIAVFIVASLFNLNFRLKFFVCLIFFDKIISFSYAMIDSLICQLSKLFFTFLIILLN